MLSFEFQTVVFQLFDFHLGKLKKFIIKNVLLSQSDVPTFNMARIGQARINTGFLPFTEIVRIFYNKYAFQVAAAILDPGDEAE